MSQMIKANYVIDYETLINCFILHVQHYKIDDINQTFIISEISNHNDIKELITFLNRNVRNQEWHISYNGLAFDAQITQHILVNQNRLLKLSPVEFCTEMYNYAQEVIRRSHNNEFQEYAPYKLKIKQIDIFKLNHWDNRAKMSSLKWIQYSMDWYNIEEMGHPHDAPVLTDETLQKLVEYCKNDVNSTRKILEHSREQILLRQSLTQEYQQDLYSASEPRISKELFLFFLEQKTGRSKSEIKKLRTNRAGVALASCILPNIQFVTPQFKNLLDFFKTQVIISTKDGFKFTVDYKGVKTDYGLGGIHGSVGPGIYTPKPGWTIMTSDAKSYYPNLAIKNKFHPGHLPAEDFCNLYEWIYNERLKTTKDDPKNYVYKIILNSTFGLSGDPNSFLYDLNMFLQITVNGQLQLSMLYEMLTQGIPEAIPLMQNTDGLEMMIPNDMIPVYNMICAEWEKITQQVLEHDQYSKMIIRDVNNYMAVHNDGKVKCKGAFEWEDFEKKKVAIFHKNKSNLVIPKAIYAYFINGTKPEDFLESNKNIFDYCAGIKSNRGWYYVKRDIVKPVPPHLLKAGIKQKRAYLLEHGWKMSWDKDNWVKTDWVNQEANNGITTEKAYKSAIQKEAVIVDTKLQKIIRYFVSNDGDKLIKIHTDGREIQVEAGPEKQTILNKVDPNKPFEEYNINKQYYLDEIYKQIEQIEQTGKPKLIIEEDTKQLKLF